MNLKKKYLEVFLGILNTLCLKADAGAFLSQCALHISISKLMVTAFVLC